ncbi:hypothetical protein metabotropic glutamate receptor [Aspergillus fumigatus]|nr:hypothetical protein metabotropic glutamate receptor [Aspergillus fumigatus]
MALFRQAVPVIIDRRALEDGEEEENGSGDHGQYGGGTKDAPMDVVDFIATPGMRQAKANETSQTACDQGKSQKYRRDHHDCLTPATHHGREAREVEYPACLLWL